MKIFYLLFSQITAIKKTSLYLEFQSYSQLLIAVFNNEVQDWSVVLKRCLGFFYFFDTTAEFKEPHNRLHSSKIQLN